MSQENLAPRGDQLATHIANGELRIIEVFGIKNFAERTTFPLSDPWSVIMRTTIEQLGRQGRLDGHDVFEPGIGDARNIAAMAKFTDSIGRVLGVDIDPIALAAAEHNLYYLSSTLTQKSDLHPADAIELLVDKHAKSERLCGWTFVCLPQSPQGDNTADAYELSDLLNPYLEKWDTYGLPLNAVILDYLGRVAADDLNVLLILSGRVPSQIREQLIHTTGWAINAEHQTTSPIQQDPDTGIAWVIDFDDGERFFERRDGLFVPLPAYEAEQRRQEALQSGADRDGLNVYHHLSVYELQPNPARQSQYWSFGEDDL